MNWYEESEFESYLKTFLSTFENENAFLNSICAATFSNHSSLELMEIREPNLFIYPGE